ncbi:9102_t:CDS:2 [Cetraspora pellucida]|uniref:9102_t:CDS:1 n=1 Tax=Cetraspora pellucida TaxID=1433469 RepID=A0ACA9JVT8_9GLOM|nr:9102_t:CDS:2 [Cetraspora pellucida]
MSIAKLSTYSEKICKELKDYKAHNHARNRIQKLGFSIDQTYALIPIQASGRRVTEQDPIEKLTQYIKENEDNLEPEEINTLAYNLAKTAPTVIAQSSRLKLLRKKLRILNAKYLTIEAIYISDITRKSNKEQAINQELREDEGLNYPEFFYLANVQERLKAKFPFLIRDKDGDVNVHPINNFLAIYGISSSYLRKIRSDHAIDIHEDENDSKRKHIHQLALRHKVIIIALDHYSVMNNRRNIPITREKMLRYQIL